jgi:DNA-binding NtrC family response regulator
MSQRILVADDDRAARTGLASLLSRWGYEVAEAANGTDALEQASRFRPSVVVADLVMPGLDGIELVKPLAETVPEAVVVLLTAHASVETAVSAMKEGAYDYLIKPVDLGRLRRLIENAVGGGNGGADGAAARPRRADSRATPRLLGKSPLIQEVNRLIEMAAESPAPVLISGETGTGKELVARTIHELSPRAKGPFVAVNCSAVPETLLESELFGFERGAFTGAANRRAGYFELADGGTLFLDEITEMSPTLQARYLRILQEGIVRRLGGTSEIRVDVRVVSASNKDTAIAVKDGSLREDLYYRLNVLHIPVPPLRRRRGDIPLLVEAFIAEFNDRYGRRVHGVEEAAMTLLDSHAWPGNVRELRNVLERAVVTCESERIAPEALSLPSAQEVSTEPLVVALPVGTTIEEGERALILKTLESVNNNKTRAAEILGTTPKTLHNKAQRWKARQ